MSPTIEKERNLFYPMSKLHKNDHLHAPKKAGPLEIGKLKILRRRSLTTGTGIPGEKLMYVPKKVDYAQRADKNWGRSTLDIRRTGSPTRLEGVLRVTSLWGTPSLHPARPVPAQDKLGTMRPQTC
eukprot:TRINITY_DN4110_c0_g1_i1.p1 TRINITY_DN4110_c0_g1~~TRINITY_DN4110_c0_g1_i1.p1  ORF type:complete len:126 (-),score=6.77 TRINITY_DN4110_c0_g1_i1:218-595(-)